MSEKISKTPNDIGHEAKQRYAGHKQLAEKVPEVERIAKSARSQAEYLRGQPSGYDVRYHLISSHYRSREQEQTALDKKEAELTEYDERTRAGFDRHNQRSEEFAETNSGQLRDLALIEAHLGGVTINVAQPLEVGERVEVDEDEQQS